MQSLSLLEGIENLHTLTLSKLYRLQSLSGLQATPKLHTLKLSYLGISDLI